MQLHTALIVVALVSSIVMLMQTSERLFSLVALVAAGIEALIVFGLISFSIAKFRIDVILPALLVLSGLVVWSRTTAKATVTASALVALIGTMQLLLSLRVLG